MASDIGPSMEMAWAGGPWKRANIAFVGAFATPRPCTRVRTERPPGVRSPRAIAFASKHLRRRGTRRYPPAGNRRQVTPHPVFARVSQTRRLSAFARYAWALLAWNVGVVLWGALVRATGSG